MSAPSKKILILGSGMVAPPCAEYLTRDPDNQVTIGKLHTLSKAVLQAHPRQHVVLWPVQRNSPPNSLGQQLLPSMSLLFRSLISLSRLMTLLFLSFHISTTRT